ncbi:putative proteophosphoglycan ppg4 [Erysiphe neolycopersici]|uniref:Putative proteophosphoglycan ppg4 n=1 Tax=Erysiphe neolycopersici TaxID=212602 RepID=A0A420HWX1_9PEZI|nr:putative proteophosphoglycan ppg4 [Erysiphe neolycopersici]
MGQQQSVPGNFRHIEHSHPGSTLESNGRYYIQSQPVSKRSSSKRSSAYSPLEEKSFNSPISKPLPNLNKELPKIQCQNQKRSSNFRSRIRSLKAQALTEETDNLCNITHQFRRSDLSCHLDSDQKKYKNDISTNPSKDYRKNNLWPQKIPSMTEKEFYYQNEANRISVNASPCEFASLRRESHVMGKHIKTDSQTRNSTTVYRNSFLRHNITAKLMPKSRAEARKSFPTSRRQHQANLLSNTEEDQNGIYQKTNNYQYNVKDAFQPQRTVTPNDLDYRHTGAFKLGTLKITNGKASPAPSIQQGIINEKRPQSRDTRTLQDPIQYNEPLPIHGPGARPWTVGWGSPLRNNKDFHPATPETLSISPDSDTEDTNFNRFNVVEERITPLKSDLEHVQNFEDQFTQSMISPYSLIELVEPSPPPQRTKMELSLRDNLFDEEPWTPLVPYHSLPNLQNRTPQILGENREYLTLTKPLAKADSGYRSNISVRSKNSNSDIVPDGDDEFRTSRSNSGAFSFVPSINLKEDKTKQKNDEYLVDSENLQLFNSLEDGDSKQKDCKSDISISYATLPSSIEPPSTPSYSNSPTQTSKNTAPNSPTNNFSPQLISSLLFSKTGKKSPESLSQRYYQDNSVEDLYQTKNFRDSYSLNLASKTLLLQTSKSQPLSYDETIKDPPNLKENYENLDKAVKHNLLAPLELPTEMTQENLPSLYTKVTHYEDVKAITPKKEVGSIESRALEDINQADTKISVNSSPPADVTPKIRMNSTPENQAEQLVEESSLKYIDSPLLIDFKENSSNILENQSAKFSNSHVKSSIFLENKERNDSDQYPQNLNQSPSPPIPKRSDLRAPRKNSLILSKESKPQLKNTSNDREMSVVTRDKVRFSTDELESNKTLSTTNRPPEDSKQSKFHHVTYSWKLGKFNQIGPRPIIVPTIVATYQAIEQTNTEKDISSLKATGNNSVDLTASRNDFPFRENKSIENSKFCLPLGLVKGFEKSREEKISEAENTQESESTWFLRRKISSQSISTNVQFPAIAKDEFQSEESLKFDNPTKMMEHHRPKRYRRSSSGLTTEMPRAVSVLQTRKSFEVRSLKNRTGYADTGRFHSLKEGVSRFITSIPSSSSSSNESNTKSDSANEKRQDLQRQDLSFGSSNTYPGSESKKSLDRGMTQNLDRKAFSNRSHNIKSSSKKGSSSTSKQNESGEDITRLKTLCPPCRNIRSHPPQAHVTCRSYSMFNQPSHIPNIENFYTYMENTKKQNLGIQDFNSTSQLLSVVEGKMPNHKREASLSKISERILDSTDYTPSERLDDKITTDEENPPKISNASESSAPISIPHQDLHCSNSNSLSSNFLNCRKSTHEYNTMCEKEQQSAKRSEEILAFKWHNDESPRIKNKEYTIHKSQNESVLNRGRPISRAVETALLSKRSDAHIGLKSNKLKNHIIQENSNFSHSISFDKNKILVEAHVPSYSEPKKEPLTKMTLTNLNLSKALPDQRRNSFSASEAYPPSIIKNSIDTLPSQKMARDITFSIPVPSQQSTLQKSRTSTDLRQNKNIEHTFLENHHPKIPLKEDYSKKTSLSQLTKSPILEKGKKSTTIGTNPLDGLLDKAPLSINTHSLLPDAINYSTPSHIEISTEDYFIETRNIESPCKDSLLKEDQDAPMNTNTKTISSLDSLPSQCKDSKLRNSKNFRRLSLSPIEGATSKDKIPEIEYSQTQRLGSRSLRNLDSIKSRQDDKNYVQTHSNSPVCGSCTSFSKNFPTIPKSISSFHNPPSLSPTDSCSTQSKIANMLNIIESDEVIMSPFLYTRPL